MTMNEIEQLKQKINTEEEIIDVLWNLLGMVKDEEWNQVHFELLRHIRKQKEMETEVFQKQIKVIESVQEIDPEILKNIKKIKKKHFKK